MQGPLTTAFKQTKDIYFSVNMRLEKLKYTFDSKRHLYAYGIPLYTYMLSSVFSCIVLKMVINNV